VKGASVEVTPHHLFLSHESFRELTDTFGKVNPPLRTEKERAGLWKCWETIDIIASDHAPHSVTEKRTCFSHAPSGIPGVETMMPLLVAKVLERNVTLSSVIRKTSANPARILTIQKAGFDIGDRADFAIYGKLPGKIRAEDLHSRCGWTPYEGMAAVFPEKVVMGGTIVISRGEFFRGHPRWFAGTGHRRRQDCPLPNP
jgi:dihydroorotase